MAPRAAVFLITLSGLIFEIGLTRIYSATIWYHFAFVAISVALLGWGLGGLVVHVLRRVWQPTTEHAGLLALLYGLSIPVCLWGLVQYPFQLERLAVYLLAPLIPFLLAGMALSIIFDRHRDAAGTLYFADLVGAALGAVVVTLLLQTVGGEGTLLIAAIAPMLAAARLSRSLRIAAMVGAAVLAGLAFSSLGERLFRVVPGPIKAMGRQMAEHPGSKATQTGWNAYSRIDAVEGLEPEFLARLYIDSDAWTNILPWDSALDSKPLLRESYRALPFRMTRGGETLVIGPGGGSDVVAALVSGSRTVTAVELNPLMIEFVRHYGARAGGVYDRPDVEVIHSEGRNFISRTDRKFDIIFLGFVDSWASVASGGLSLSENYLYTAQAMRAYYDHLTDDGMLVIMRWDIDIPRLVSNAVAVLGAADASERIAALLEHRNGGPTDPSQMLFMLRKRPWAPAETNEIMTEWTRLGRPVLVPGRHADQPYAEVLAGRKTLEAYEAESPRFVGPVFDDSPFYFAIERPWGMSRGIGVKLIGFLLVPAVLLLAVLAAFGKPAGQPVAPYAASVGFFMCLGFGFITVELALLQHLTLLLGHPIFTLSVLLFTLLAAGGLGSALSARIPVRVACLAVAVIGGIEALVLRSLVPALLPLPLWARVLAAMLLIAPLGLAMGVPFPQGLRRTGRGALPATPFYWALNGIMSVIGSVVTVFVALRLGFQVAMLIGCGLYLLAALASRQFNGPVRES